MTDRALTILLYCCVLAAGAALELLGRSRTDRFVSLATILGAIRAHLAGRVLLLLTWAFVTWHLLSR